MNPPPQCTQSSHVFFDLDRTLIKGDAFVYITLEAIKRGLFRWYEYPLMLFLLIQEVFSVIFIPRLFSRGFILYRNKPVAAVEQAISAVQSTILDHLYTEAIDTIKAYKRTGTKIYIVTATFPQIAKLIMDTYDLDGYYGTILKTTTKHGREFYTGFTEGYLRGFKKARLLEQEFSAYLTNSASYSDSIIDHAFLKATAEPHVVNPDLRLRLVARYKKWPIHQFRTIVRDTRSAEHHTEEQ